MAEATRQEAVYTIRLEQAGLLKGLEKQTQQLVEARAERVRLGKEIRNSIAQERELEAVIKQGGASADGAAKQLVRLREKRAEDVRAITDQNLKYTALSANIRELQNDLSGVTEAGLRFRDKMADATLQAIRQSGALETLITKGDLLNRGIKENNAAIERNEQILGELRIAYSKTEKSAEELAKEEAKITAENDRLRASNDKLAEDFKAVNTRIDEAEKQVKELNAALQSGKIGIDEYKASVQKLQDSTKGLGDKFDSFVSGQAKELKSTLSSVALQYVGVGAAIYGVQQVLGSAVSAVVDFDAALARVKALGGDYRTNIEGLGNAAREIGPKFGIGVAEAVGAIEALAKAGVSSGDILSGGLEGALTLAAAGSLEVSKAAEIAASALTQFGLKGADVVKVADLLAGGSLNAQGSVEDLGAALNQSGLVAANFGIPIEEAVGALSAFASSGLLGSDAGTSFKTMLQSLVPRSKEAADKMKELGLNFFDAQGEFVGLEQVAGQLQDKLKGLTQEQQQSALKTIFGSDAVRAATVLYNQGATGVAEWTSKVSEAGVAARVAGDNLDSISGKAATLSASWGKFVTSVDNGTGVLSRAFQGAIAGATGLLNVLSELNAQGDILGKRGIASGKAIVAESDVRAYGDAVKQYANEFRDLGKFAGNVDGYFAQQQALLRAQIGSRADDVEKLTELQRIYRQRVIESDAASKEFGVAMVNLSQVEIALAAAKGKGIDATKKKAEAEAAGAVVTDTNTETNTKQTESVRIVTGSIADYRAQLQLLQEQQSQSTTSAQFAQYQTQIDTLNASIEDVMSGARALANEAANPAPLNSPTPDGPEPLPDDFLFLQTDTDLNAQFAANLEERKLMNADELESYQALQDAKIAAVGGFASALGQLTKEGTTAAKVLFALEKASAIAQVIVNTVREVSAINALYAAVPGGQAIAAPLTLAAKIRGATGVATIAAQAIAGFAGGGDISGDVTRGWGIPVRRANGDNVLVQAGDRWITLKGDEKVLNEQQQREAERIAGPNIWSNIGLPGYNKSKTGFAGGGRGSGEGSGVTYSAGTGIRDLVLELLVIQQQAVSRMLQGIGGFSTPTEMIVGNLATPSPAPSTMVSNELTAAMQAFASKPTFVDVREITDTQNRVRVNEAIASA